MTKSIKHKLLYYLSNLYGKKKAAVVLDEINNFILPIKNNKSVSNLSEKDTALITYADSVISKKDKPLKSLYAFIKNQSIHKFLNTLHILPFYPWDTDRGFSVIDYRKVKNEYGDWTDIKRLSRLQNLMFDFVANHISIDNPIAQESLISRHVDIKTEYKDFILAYSELDKPKKMDLINLARPRPNPVLTPYYITKTTKGFKAVLGSQSPSQKSFGAGYVWTTFSRPVGIDGKETTRQVDLNFKNPKVLIETIKILNFYINKGARLIRLDAIGYIWKKLGSNSLHEDEAHQILKTIRLILSSTHPEVISIAEVNEQQDKVFTYLGSSKSPEAQMVYQFTHFPLAVYSLMTNDSTDYAKWYASTKQFNGRQFITVLGSHDGLGLKPIRNILSDNQIQILETHLVKNQKALPNFATLPGGKKIIYELCATPWNLINSDNTDESEEIKVKRYLVVVALGLLVKGLPAFYINGLIGSTNYIPKNGLDENRTINRESFNLEKLQKTITSPKSTQYKTIESLKKLIQIRTKHPEFNPHGPFPKIPATGNKSVFALLLESDSKKEPLLSIINVSGKEQKMNIPNNLKIKIKLWNNLIDNRKIKISDNLKLSPYEILWLKPVH